MSEYVFKLPDVGEGTAEAEISAWHVEVGARVQEDQPLVDVMTDKAVVEISSPVSGIVVSIHGEVGALVAVGSPLVVFRLEGAASGAALAAAAPSAPAPARAALAGVATPATLRAEPHPESKLKSVRETAGAAGTPAPGAAATPPPKPTASPAVRQRAFELGIALQSVPGSGPAGRITREDLEAYVANASAANAGAANAGTAPAPPRGGDVVRAGALAPRTGVEQIKIIGLRRKIAEKMQEAKRRIPHITYVEELDLTQLEELRAHLNAGKRAEQPKLTLLPFFMRALVRVLPAFPQINAHYDDEAGVLQRYEAVHLGIATQTRNGLLVPVVRHAETRDLWDCAAELARVAQAAREGKATRDELSGSTITITSMGALGGVIATHVINYPEVAIIGPNKLIERPVVRNGQITVRKMMNLSSSFDHRIVDGYDAAEFVQRLKGVLEHPAMLFLDTP